MRVLRHKAFARLVAAYLVSQAGSKVHRVALLHCSQEYEWCRVVQSIH